MTHPASIAPEHELVLPWPDRALHPNARPHWAVKAKATKKARADAKVLTLANGWGLLKLPEGRLHLWITFDPPSRRDYDDDGCLSSFKAWRDGIADALKINDARFISHPYVSDKPVKGGCVRVRITGGPDALVTA